MTRLAPFLALLITASGCAYGDGFFLAPTGPANTSAFVASAPLITVGQPLTSTFIGNPLFFDLRAPVSGTLVLRLTWHPRPFGARFLLSVGGTPFLASAPAWSPIVGRVAVFAGQTYRVRIEEGFAPWDYGFNDSFVLLATME